MGNSGSSLQPVLVQRQTLQCDSNGVARFERCTVHGGPANPGFYRIVCNANFNDAEVRGVMMGGQITQLGFVAVGRTGNTRTFRYVPGTARTPVLKGFKGKFTAVQNRMVHFELWWIPLDYYN